MRGRRTPVAPPSSAGRNRRSEIITAASALICRYGYRAVTLKDVATSVGVSAPALYRHFPSKQAVLVAAINDGLDVAEVAARSTDGGLDPLLMRLARAAVDERNLWMLLHREWRHLGGDERARLESRYSRLVERISAAISLERSGIDRETTEVLARAVLAALSAPSQYRQSLGSSALVTALVSAAGRIARAEVGSARSGRERQSRPGNPFQPDLDRREAILAAAAGLFAHRGYHDVSIDDIGAAVSIAGPSIYNHFDSKSDILAGVVWRSVDWIEADLTRAAADCDSAEETLHELYTDYAELAVQHRELFDVFTVEGVNLPGGEKDRIGRAHGTFIDRWASLLRKARPTLSSGSARAQVCASLCVINELGRTSARNTEQGADRLVALAMAAVDL